MTPSRLSAQASLTKILPEGAEGGKEFARIVSLLLLKQAKSIGREFTIFDDASGDFEGLDSYSSESKSKNAIGFQYKFYPSPLSDSHRQKINEALENSIKRSSQLKLKKWILVTPDDLKNSGTRKDGGDVSWFEKLREKHSKNGLEIEHIGHTKLQDLFLGAPLVALFYYPQLVPNGTSRAKTIEETRAVYDQQMKSRYGRIEFVGMPVYKEDTSRRVPLDEIYIPLSVVGERAAPETDDTPRINPISLLGPGTRSVVLGDPGSGKSTMLAYLALVGISSGLQARAGVSSDARLTVVITLRRYADELKNNFDLPLIEHMVNVATADFNLLGIGSEFYEYYFEAGRAIVMFDGLDELPSSKFKATVKQRIESFASVYPLSAVVITSRLVGYDVDFRLDKTYSHYRVAKLRFPEIQKFIYDWYSARLDNSKEITSNSNDLIGVVERSENESIRDLARNPLLLTIVSLVHRIDAVLPDERVVLYQKCTETLLNTWYRAKHRDDGPVKGRVERRNRLRIESIAYWMQKQSMGDTGRSVAPHQDLVAHLTKYIEKKERVKDTDEMAEDQAEEFLAFIKNTAGLMVEAGDRLYGFIHLTFQEYLCATHLSTSAETGGLQSIWDELGGDLQNPRWREVVRLLVSSLKSSEGQQFFVERLLQKNSESSTKDGTLLLLGLLKDGVVPAEYAAEEITMQAYGCLLKTAAISDALTLEESLQSWIEKNRDNLAIATGVYDEMYEKQQPRVRQQLALIRVGMNLPEMSAVQKSLITSTQTSRADQLFHSLVLGNKSLMFEQKLIDDLFATHMVLASESPESNIVGVTLLAVAILCAPSIAPSLLFRAELSMLPWVASGPRHDHGMNIVAAALPRIGNVHPTLKKALMSTLTRKRNKGSFDRHIHASRIYSKLANLNTRTTSKNEDLQLQALDYWRSQIVQLPFNQQKGKKSLRNTPRIGLIFDGSLEPVREGFIEKIDENPAFYWSMYCDSDIFNTSFSECIHACVNFEGAPLWVNALRIKIKDEAAGAIARYLDADAWIALESRFISKNFSSEDIDWAAWLLLFDSWIWCNRGYEKSNQSPFLSLCSIVSDISDPRIKLAVSAYRASHPDAYPDVDFWRVLEKDDGSIRNILASSGWNIPARNMKRAK